MANYDPREDRDPLGDLRFARFVQAQHAREERVGRFRAEEVSARPRARLGRRCCTASSSGSRDAPRADHRHGVLSDRRDPTVRSLRPRDVRRGAEVVEDPALDLQADGRVLECSRSDEGIAPRPSEHRPMVATGSAWGWVGRSSVSESSMKGDDADDRGDEHGPERAGDGQTRRIARNRVRVGRGWGHAEVGDGEHRSAGTRRRTGRTVDHNDVRTRIEAGDEEGDPAVAVRVDSEAPDVDESGIVLARHVIRRSRRNEVCHERIDLARENALASGRSRDPRTCGCGVEQRAAQRRVRHKSRPFFGSDSSRVAQHRVGPSEVDPPRERDAQAT